MRIYFWHNENNEEVNVAAGGESIDRILSYFRFRSHLA